MRERKVTVRDIAQQAGVHYATVSRALSGHPSIPDHTKERIRTIAKQLGYVPDPMLSALAAYRTRLGRGPTRETWPGSPTVRPGTSWSSMKFLICIAKARAAGQKNWGTP